MKHKSDDPLTEILEIVRDILRSEAAQILAERLSNLAKAQWLPDADVATDAYGLAAMLNRTSSTAHRKIEGCGSTVTGAGTHLVMLRDLLRHLRGTAEAAEPRPVMGPGELWRLSDAAAALGVDETTVARWEEAGLVVCRPATKNKYVVSDDILKIMRMDAAEIPAYQPRYKRKASAATRGAR